MILDKIQQFSDSVSKQPLFTHAKITMPDPQSVSIELPFFVKQEQARLCEELKVYLNTLGEMIQNITIESKAITYQVQSGLKPLAGVKNIIAVASGKGGVGKSTVSINLAAALQLQGANVGILDADIYGPSQAMMLGGAKRPLSHDGQTIEPVIRHGMQTLSMADLIEDDTAVIWRGPMVTQTLTQLLHESNWQDLDYLIIDLPPGTGDIQLTLAQQIPVAGAVIVSTPQDIALLDAKRAKAMFDKVNVPTLGLIENMSIFTCPHCQKTTAIFGQEGGKKLADDYNLPLLGQLPLDIALRESTDSGTPLALTDHRLQRSFCDITFKLSVELSLKRKGFRQVFPKIVME